MEFKGAAKPLTQGAFDDVRTRLNIEPASLWAILTVETRGMGFFADRKPKILFERHIFHKRTNGKFRSAAPDLSDPTQGGYTGGAAEYSRLARAMALDEAAALESVSWGLGQIMGFNAIGLKYASATEMINGFCASEDAQLEGTRRFIANSAALNGALSDRQWAKVAFFYNGSNYVVNEYDKKLQRCYVEYSEKQLPDMDIRAAQVRLTYLGFDPHGVDGVAGHGTKAATSAFQKEKKLPVTGELDQSTKDELLKAAGV